MGVDLSGWVGVGLGGNCGIRVMFASLIHCHNMGKIQSGASCNVYIAKMFLQSLS